eukprot:jgi/Chlat1/5281/Chrsp35S05239
MERKLPAWIEEPLRKLGISPARLLPPRASAAREKAAGGSTLSSRGEDVSPDADHPGYAIVDTRATKRKDAPGYAKPSRVEKSVGKDGKHIAFADSELTELVDVELTTSNGRKHEPGPERHVGGTPSKRSLGNESTYRTEGYFTTLRLRGGWLCIFFVGLVLTAAVVETFEASLHAHVELSDFMPLLVGHGGNTGSQAAAAVIRAMAMGQVTGADLLFVLRKEASTGCIIGGMLGLLCYLGSFLTSRVSAQLGLTIFLTLPVVSFWANLLGGLIPLMCAHFGLDPTATSMPFIGTVMDVSGLVIYFHIARLVYMPLPAKATRTHAHHLAPKPH